MFFDGFTLDESGPIRMRSGGSGPPLLLLHGRPQTHAMWHAVAGRLAGRFTLICPDLPPHCIEAALASDMLSLMTRLGHERFGVAGHDLGGHVACRMALDAASRIIRLAALEIVPAAEHMNRTDMTYSLTGYPNCWFGQLHPLPEALATHAPAAWSGADADADGRADFFHPEAVADYLRAAARLNDRPPNGLPGDTGAVPRPTAEAADRRHLTCPVLAIWGSSGRIGGWYDPLQLWRECVDNEVSGGPVPAGYFLAEERPDMIAAAFRDFFVGNRRPPRLGQKRAA